MFLEIRGISYWPANFRYLLQKDAMDKSNYLFKLLLVYVLVVVVFIIILQDEA